MLTLRDECDIVIYGTGLAGKMVFDALSKMKIRVSFFGDGNNEKIGTSFCGKEIVDINKINKDTIVLIAANPSYGIHQRLERAGINRWEYVDPAFLDLLSEGYDKSKIEHILKSNKNKIFQVYNMLEDEKSKQVLRYVLQHRLEHKLALIAEIYDENQYFGNDVINTINGNFVDCGAYGGDTLKRFMGQIEGGGYFYYAFEAETSNYYELKKYCQQNCIKNVNIYNLAVYDEKKRFSFIRDQGKEKVSGKISEVEDSASYIQADSIDNVLENKKIDMITMDIEGAEIHALLGAKKIINKFHPKLAISAYHSIEHLWEIPLLIKEINPGYHLYYRHHRWNMHDTVCYAIYNNEI